jgi:hypothetical protein
MTVAEHRLTIITKRDRAADKGRIYEIPSETAGLAGPSTRRQVTGNTG